MRRRLLRCVVRADDVGLQWCVHGRVLRQSRWIDGVNVQWELRRRVRMPRRLCECHSGAVSCGAVFAGRCGQLHGVCGRAVWYDCRSDAAVVQRRVCGRLLWQRQWDDDVDVQWPVSCRVLLSSRRYE